MTRKPYDVAVGALTGLTTDELRKLRDRISSLISSGPSSVDRVVTSLSHDDWIIMGLAAYMRDAGMPPVSVEHMMNSPQYSLFKRKCVAVEAYLKQVGNKNAQRALLRAGLTAMHKRMSVLRISISYLTFMGWIHRLPGCINREFPGYMESGLLTMIIRGENNVRQKQSQRPVQRKRSEPADQ